MVIIAETNKLYLSHICEHVQLIDKESDQVLFTDDFYGDPSCGFIDVADQYAIIAGKHLTLWTRYNGVNEITKFETQVFHDIEQLRLIDENTIEILVDPWSEHGSVWQLSVSNKSLRKVSDFIEYKDLPYTDNIDW